MDPDKIHIAGRYLARGIVQRTGWSQSNLRSYQGNLSIMLTNKQRGTRLHIVRNGACPINIVQNTYKLAVYLTRIRWTHLCIISGTACPFHKLSCISPKPDAQSTIELPYLKFWRSTEQMT